MSISPNPKYLPKDWKPNSEKPKCIITGKETDRKCKGKPLSREGMEQVKAYQKKVDGYSEETGLKYLCTTKMAIQYIIDGFDLVQDAKDNIERIQRESLDKLKVEKEKKDLTK